MIHSNIFSNDSAFGRLFTRLGILIAANFLFCIFCLPVFTVGAAFTALHHTVLRAMRSKDPINPFAEYWKGFRMNFLQSTLAFFLLAAAMILGFLNLYWCSQLGGVFLYIRYGVWAILFVLTATAIHIFPVIAAFDTNIGGQFRNALYFVCQKPLQTLVLVFFTVMPIYLTVTDPRNLPIYGFIWVFCGWGLLCQLCGALLLPRFRPFLDAEPIETEKTEKQILEEMKKLDM